MSPALPFPLSYTPPAALLSIVLDQFACRTPPLIVLAEPPYARTPDFIAAMAFQFAATNLVMELGVLLIMLLGWQFGVAEFIGGPIT